MRHETFLLGLDSSIEESERWMHSHGVDWGPLAPGDPLNRFGIFESDAPTSWLDPQGRREKMKYLGRQALFAVELGDTLCWDGARVWLHASRRQEVKTCKSRRRIC